MFQGIAILGLNGSGKSTLAHALAKLIDYFEIDVEDYYFPEQRDGRKQALEGSGVCDTGETGDKLPFSNPRSKEEVQTAILQDIKTHPEFILSGVTMNWCDEILSQIDIAFLVQTPVEERLRRIQSREEKRFGARVLKGGDMFAQQSEFRQMVESRNPQIVEESAEKIGCPIVVLDGTVPVAENLRKILDEIKEIG